MRNSCFIATFTLCTGAAIAHADPELVIMNNHSVQTQVAASGLSSDGKFAAGTWIPENQTDRNSFRWRTNHGKYAYEELKTSSGDGLLMNARAVSNSGVVVGTGPQPGALNAAMRWTSAGAVYLGDLDGGISNSDAAGISDDGSFIVGTGTSSLGREAYYWTESTGMVGLGYLTGGTSRSHATAVSGNGGVVAGQAFNSANTSEAFRWTQSGGMNSIGVPDGFNDSRATAVSPNGKYITGAANHALGIGAFIWDEVGGMRVIGTPNSTFGLVYVTDVSDNGTAIGFIQSGSQAEACIWRPDGTLVFIDVLTLGLPMADQVFFEHGIGISADGNTLLMNGYWEGSNEPMTAVLMIPAPGSIALVTLGGLIAARRRR
jgi:uncharacterized membrane protein